MHKKVMTDKAALYTEAIAQTNLWWWCCWWGGGVAYNTFHLASFSYGTPATSLSYNECDELQKPIFNAILPKVGINRNASRVITF
jgi:hypothetical protein